MYLYIGYYAFVKMNELQLFATQMNRLKKISQGKNLWHLYQDIVINVKLGLKARRLDNIHEGVSIAKERRPKD